LNENGWEKVYDLPYSHRTTDKELEDMKALCTAQTMLCVGACQIETPDNIMLCAIDNAYEALTHTDSITEARKSKNGIYWYWGQGSSGKAFGFSPEKKIMLCNPDDEPGDKRLSWRTTGSGFRIGNLRDLNTNEDYRKIIYMKN